MTTTSVADRSREVRRVLWVVLLLNLAVSAVKLAIGLSTGALAIVAVTSGSTGSG